MAKKPTNQQSRASKPPATVIITATMDEDTGRYTGVVSHPRDGGGPPVVDYKSSKAFVEQTDALEEAASWCKDRGIQYTFG